MATAEVSWTNLETGTIQAYDFEFHEHPSQPLKAFYELRFESFGYTPGLPESLRRGIARLQYIEEELAYFNHPHACSGGIQAFCDNTLE